MRISKGSTDHPPVPGRGSYGKLLHKWFFFAVRYELARINILISGAFSGIFQMYSNLVAAIRWFPSQGQTIEERAARDESFRSICEDLADAEFALQKMENSTSPKHDQRCSEYRELVDSLAKEIAVALSREGEE